MELSYIKRTTNQESSSFELNDVSNYLKDGDAKIPILKILNNIFWSYIRRNHKSTDYFYMAANSFDTNWADCIIEQIEKLGDEKTIEVGVHPGSTEKWRINEFNDINEFSTKLKNTKHQIINWNDIC